MSNDDNGAGLLSKVARFVMNPTVNWSELDSALPGTGTQQDRQALKAAIERRRRNDQVRKREFNMLRALMRQRQAADAHDRPSYLNSADSAQADERKEKTIEKIAQIEAQMSQHWLRRRGTESDGGQRFHIGGTAVPSERSGEVAVAAHLQATVPPGSTQSMATTLPIDMFASDSKDPHTSIATTQQALSTSAVEEAAVRFANGDELAVEQGLRSALVQELGTPGAQMAWQALLDYCVAARRVDEFEKVAQEYAPVFGVQAPEWPDGDVPAVADEAAMAWTCPMLLDTAAVQDLQQALARGGDIKWLDWSALVSADLAAAQALLDLVDQWLQQPVEFRFVGGHVLRRRLKASTPSGRRENDPLWWRLRLAVLRWMHRQDEFDLASLDFCVTYGVLPPDWSLPQSTFLTAEGLPVSGLSADMSEPEVAAVLADPIRPLATQLAGLDAMEWPAVAADTVLHVASRPPLVGVGGGPRLAGVLSGDIAADLAALQSAMEQHPAGARFPIDCHGLHRIDFPAAGSLLQWLLAAMTQGMQPELVGVSRLVAAFLHVVGIDEAAPVRLREY